MRRSKTNIFLCGWLGAAGKGVIGEAAIPENIALGAVVGPSLAPTSEQQDAASAKGVTSSENNILR